MIQRPRRPRLAWYWVLQKEASAGQRVAAFHHAGRLEPLS